ncbi:hypothetical protein D3C77_765440 [compost metagenome]
MLYTGLFLKNIAGIPGTPGIVPRDVFPQILFFMIHVRLDFLGVGQEHVIDLFGCELGDVYLGECGADVLQVDGTFELTAGRLGLVSR